MQTEPNAKQQIVEKIKNSTNILVTVGSNPSVDALSAALSLTLMLNRLDKHATAVFSGQVPPAITFLEPDKTFEDSVDSLRDFIIALDKEKADRLRYKVEDDVVRIFITPYKTILSENDLKFSQGDFNVELIIALGVEKREDLDAAITAHGRILHDATVMTINADNGPSTLGSVDWSESSASSLCEMLMSLSEALQSGLLDQQIATALLTGIVAATDRFRNEQTSPKVMTMAAQLMAAGANQQLIAAKLEEGHTLPDPEPSNNTPDETQGKDGAVKLTEGRSEKVVKKAKKAAASDGALEISHSPAPDTSTNKPDPGADALKEAENELAKSLEQSTTPVTPAVSLDDIQNDLKAAASDLSTAAGETDTPPAPTQGSTQDTPKIIKQDHRNWRSEPDAGPAFSGTLNATVSEAEEANRQEEQTTSNHTLLSHDRPKAAIETAEKPAEPAVPPAPKPVESTDDEVLSFEPTPVAPTAPTLAEIDEQTRGKDAEAARAAIDAALSAIPFDPASKPVESAGAVPALELTHDNAQPSMPEAPVAPQATEQQPADVAAHVSPSVLPMPPPLPPLPDFSDPALLAEAPTATPPSSPVPSVEPQIQPLPPENQQPVATPVDPGQFKIPGQS